MFLFAHSLGKRGKHHIVIPGDGRSSSEQHHEAQLLQKLQKCIYFICIYLKLLKLKVILRHEHAAEAWLLVILDNQLIDGCLCSELGRPGYRVSRLNQDLWIRPHRRLQISSRLP